MLASTKVVTCVASLLMVLRLSARLATPAAARSLGSVAIDVTIAKSICSATTVMLIR